MPSFRTGGGSGSGFGNTPNLMSGSYGGGGRAGAIIPLVHNPMEGFKPTVGGGGGNMEGARAVLRGAGMSGLFSAENVGDLVKLVAITAATKAVISMTSASIKMAAEFEQTSISFKTMIGDAGKAAQLVGDVRGLANRSPFESRELLGASRSLLGYGFELNQIMPTLTMLGDVSAGTGKDIRELSIIYGQIRSAGRLMGQDMLQLVQAGFNPLQQISKDTGKSMAVLKDEMSRGLITFDMVEKAFKSATSEGGLFFNMMNEQSQTLNGKWSTLQDSLHQTGEAIATNLIGPLKEVVSLATVASESIKNVAQGNASTTDKAIIATGVGGVGLTMAAILTKYQVGTKIGAWVASLGEAQLALAALAGAVTTMGIGLIGAGAWNRYTEIRDAFKSVTDEESAIDNNPEMLARRRSQLVKNSNLGPLSMADAIGAIRTLAGGGLDGATKLSINNGGILSDADIRAAISMFGITSGKSLQGLNPGSLVSFLVSRNADFARTQQIDPFESVSGTVLAARQRAYNLNKPTTETSVARTLGNLGSLIGGFRDLKGGPTKVAAAFLDAVKLANPLKEDGMQADPRLAAAVVKGSVEANRILTQRDPAVDKVPDNVASMADIMKAFFNDGIKVNNLGLAQ